MTEGGNVASLEKSWDDYRTSTSLCWKKDLTNSYAHFNSGDRGKFQFSRGYLLGGVADQYR